LWPSGLRYYPERLDRTAQESLLAELETLLGLAPLFQPVMPRSGKPFSVRMSNAGPLGWVSDRAGYRYQPAHPTNGRPWPPIPGSLLDLWRSLSDYPAPPEACLINRYAAGARMGLHRDADEDAKDAPVVSLSLGDTALFRVGGPARRDPTASLRLASGDVLVLGGTSRKCYHGVDRVLCGSSRLIAGGGRINVTMRRVTIPD